MHNMNRTRMILGVLLIFMMASPPLLISVAQDVDLHIQDTDEDGISDWDEINRYESNPNNPDSDGDLIDDYREVSTGTSPMDPDSDGDGFPDFDEYSLWNPDAISILDRHYRCPYIADLPELTTTVLNDRIENHIIFEKGTETHEERSYSQVKQTTNTFDWKRELGASLQAWIEVSWGFGFGSRGLKESGLAFEAGVRGQFDAGSTWTWNHNGLEQETWEDKEVTDDYSNRKWDVSTVTLHMDVEISNSYNREIRLDTVVFDLALFGSRVSSEEWSPGWVLAPGESHSTDISFTMSGEEWIEALSYRKMDLAVHEELVEISIFDEATDDFISEDVMSRRIWDRCVLVTIPNSPLGPIRRFVTAHVDKIDGLNVLEALDRLFLSYTYRYGRLMDIMGVESRPGEEVWAYQYHNVWHDPDSAVREGSFVDLNMWGRGALLISLETDSDGDWLIDDLERWFGTDIFNPDTDGDYADDYIEVVLAKCNPFVNDTDGGGTSDGIEYFEGFDPNDPSDDKLQPPMWYTNHQTMQTAQRAADILLRQATSPSADELTWSVPLDPAVSSSHDYSGIVRFVTNDTLGLGYDETISAIDIGDMDGDNISEIVLGTSPYGYVILLEDDDGDGSWENTVIDNLSAAYGVFPVAVSDVCIGDANDYPLDGNEIVASSYYFDGAYTGRVHMYKNVTGVWNNDEVSGPIIGGVYSIDIGETCGIGKTGIAVGQGATESFVKAQVRVYWREGSGWDYIIPVNTTSSRAYVTIGDVNPEDYDGDELVFCTYGLNSTLGYVGYNNIAGSRTIETIREQFDFAGDPPPYEKYMCVEIGDFDKNGINELIYAVDRTFIGTDSLWMYNHYAGNASILDNIELYCPRIAFDDFDNDGWDEVIYHVVDPAGFPDTNVSVYEWNGISWNSTTIENATEPYVTCIAAGDIDIDGEVEVLYGTSGNGILRQWDHPAGALWPTETHEWNVEVRVPEPWIYEGEPYPINVTAFDIGPYDMNDINMTISVHENVVNATPWLQSVTSITPGTNATCSFLLWPTTSGNYTMSVEIISHEPRIYHYSEYFILVVPRIPQQAQIGQALLELALYTNNQTLLDAAVKVGNWLESVHIQSGSFYAWNGDTSITESVLPGYVLSTIRTGRFFLELFRATGDFDFLVNALDAVSFLGDPYEGNMTVIDLLGLAWASHDNGVAEAAEAAELLFETNKELLFDYFAPTLSGVSTYLMTLADNGTLTTNWLESSGLTQAVSSLFTSLEGAFLEPAQWAGNWLAEEIQSDPEWMAGLSPSYKSGSPYEYYTGTGLAGLCDALVLLASAADSDCLDEITQVANQLISQARLTSQGTNWRESSWPADLQRLVTSVNWDYGSAGVASALVAAYRATGNQTYLDYALDASYWMENSLSDLGASDMTANVTSEALSDIIRSMIDIHATLPVVFVGYFVDPMTSLSGMTFNLSGYVQTIGYHASAVNITLDIPSAFRAHGQEKTISIGTIAEPSGVVVDWVITPLAYGEFTIGVQAVSTNAGNQTTNATILVTDIGVTKLRESGAGFAALSLAQSPEDLYNLGETVWLPVEAEYYNGDPAINASIKVGAMGTTVINASGVAYIGVTSIDPGTMEIPISIRYDKKTGITSGTENITVELTFTGLEVYDASCSATIASSGEPITFYGKVRYAHDHSLLAGATVCLNGEPMALTDAEGNFVFQFTEATAGLKNYTLTAIADADHRITVSALSQEFQVEWSAFWTPVTMAVAAGSVGAIVVVISIALFRRKKGRWPVNIKRRGFVNVPVKK